MTKADRAIFLNALTLLLLVAAVVVAARWLPVAEYVTGAQRWITELGPWGAVLYPFAFAACNVLLLPGGILAVGAGLFFGLWWGWLSNMIGATLGALIAVSLARRFGRTWVLRRWPLRGRWARLDAAVAREGPRMIFLSQVHPMFPTSLLNYLYGLSRVPIRVCVWWIALGQLPGMLLYSGLGRLAQSGLRAWRGETALTAWDWVAWGIGLASMLALTIVLARKALRIFAESGATGDEENELPPAVPVAGDSSGG